MLDTQLAALARAAASSEAELWVMAPMVADAADAAWFVSRARAHGLTTVGAMIEIPSAALTAGALLGAVDFASIGTNDLTQYTLAADRQLGAMAALQDPWHPGVLRLIEAVGAAGAPGRQAGRGVRRGRGGSAAGVRAGGARRHEPVDVARPRWHDVRAELARRTYDECVDLARRALATASAAEARAACS